MRIKRIVFFILISLMVIFLHGEIKFKVSGRVVNHAEGIPGIKIRFYNETISKSFETESSFNGEFNINVPDGRYKIIAMDQKGYTMKKDEPIYIEVKEKNINNLIIEMIRGGNVCGRVLTNDKRLRIRGIVSLLDKETGHIGFLGAIGGEVNKTGKFCLTYVRQCSKFVIMIKPFGFMDWIEKKWFSIKEGEKIKDVLIEIPEVQRTIEGKLIDRNTGRVLKLIEDGVDNFIIALYMKPDPKKIWTYFPCAFGDVYEDGNFYFYNIHSGRYTLKVNDRDKNYKDIKIPLLIKKGETKKLIIKMKRRKKK